MITWIMELGAKGPKPMPFNDQANMQLITTMAAIHTTTLTVTNFLYDLVARPEYLEPLREEVESEWQSGDLTKATLRYVRCPPGLGSFPKLILAAK
jgi:cytochrome P450